MSGGEPRYMTLRTTESGSQVVVWPRPDKQYSLAITWVLRESPPYTNPVNQQVYAKFLNWAPTAVLYKCLAETASFFNEVEMKKEFEMRLYGTPGPKADFSAIENIGGLIGGLKEESERQNRQIHQQAKFWPSLARASGRHNPLAGGKVLPFGYGYIF